MAEEKKAETEEKLIPVGDGADETPDESVEDQLKREKKQESGDEETSDERVGHSETEEDEGESPEGETVEQKRERRRLERRNHRAKEERIRREHSYLLRRNQQVERHLTEMARRLDEQENSGIDNRVGVVDSQIRDAETIHAQAVAEQDGKTATEALKLRDQLREHKQALLGRKKKPEEETDDTSTQAPVPDPAIQREGRAWWDRNKSWFKPDLSDENSHLAKVVEDRMANEGNYDPRTPEYWEELDRRLEARGLRPKQKGNGKVNGRDDIDWGDNDDEDDDSSGESRSSSKESRRENRREPPPKKKANGGPRFSVGGRERPLGKNEVFIDAERRKALEEAGLWEDESTRNRYLKSYQQYDKDPTNRRTR